LEGAGENAGKKTGAMLLKKKRKEALWGISNSRAKGILRTQKGTEVTLKKG